MQASPSFIASGEHFVSLFPSPDIGTSPLVPFAEVVQPLSEPGAATEIAEGIGLAHDAGNLLGAIRLYCDLLALPGVLQSEHRHYADALRQLTARSGSLIDRLLRPAARMEAGPGSVKAETKVKTAASGERVRLADAVMECRGMLEPVVGAGSLLIAVEDGARGEVTVPREALERILLNLIKNAAEARGVDAKEEGRGAVAVRVRTIASWGPRRVHAFALSVEDRGRGMDESALRAVLSGKTEDQPPRDESRPGRGIGLSVVRELVTRTGGELRMRSRLGLGTTVEIVWAAVPQRGAESG